MKKLILGFAVLASMSSFGHNMPKSVLLEKIHHITNDHFKLSSYEIDKDDIEISNALYSFLRYGNPNEYGDDDSYQAVIPLKKNGFHYEMNCQVLGVEKKFTDNIYNYSVLLRYCVLHGIDNNTKKEMDVSIAFFGSTQWQSHKY